MKQFIELGAVWIGAAIQNFCASVDFEVLSLPGGSLIAVLLWLYATVMVFIRGAAAQVRASGSTIDARSFAGWIIATRQVCQQSGG
jgi:uncharacterized BrkB/YihY/UPF0761 family membrane protein